MEAKRSDSECERLRLELLDLNKKRDAIDAEIKMWSQQNVGMDDELVDKDGFPRNDVDIYQIRTARNKIICLRNDGKALMKQIEEKLYKYHAMNPPDPEPPRR
ncbi:26S proteasome non-ATPase regulatory subunit 9-like protein [Dinothrombium tinctorium]|uniref:26S proteasome non-ATPase regulatory subunit 9-like protein n=1 Tax=Dinothrombium tinctorium TaxID=1965070 RepID=A0A443QJX9_9ACAR|nr:26S proteasome non-ATPase regulatory subunit 9-like protein [Dinothrombium tinctorium]